MLQAVLRLVAPPDKRDEILRVFSGMSGPTEVTKGCRRCRVLCDVNNDDAIIYWVQWDTREELEDHLRSERFRKLIPYIEMSLEPPEVEISQLDVIGGIEIVVSAIEARHS
ncbi:putative quinol monooxygenase [Roseiconus nitratireducens]|nr:antibiotic biosynthesis monooxygenase family protein [Roseiconus nitratireducens]